MGRRGKKRPIRKRISLDRGKEEREDEKDASTQLCQRKGEKKTAFPFPFFAGFILVVIIIVVAIIILFFLLLLYATLADCFFLCT